jgi:hypothetical protein
MSPTPLCFLLLASVLSAAEIPLAHGPHRDLTLKPGPDSVLEVRLGEGHPHFWTAIVPGAYDPARQTVLALDCFAPSGFDSLVLRYRVESGDMAIAEVRQVSFSETWQPLVFDLSQLEVKPAAGHPEMRFHFALNGKPGTELQLRRIRLREPTAEEQRLAANRERLQAEREADAEAILADLRATYPARIESVHVGAEVLTLSGRSPGPARLIGIAPETASHRADPRAPAVAEITPDAQGRFRIDLPRTSAGAPRDRALWRWRLANNEARWLSAASWPTAYGPAVGRQLPRLSAPHQKGIGVPPLNRADHELFSLGLRHATVNIVVTTLLRDTPAPGWQPWAFEGKTWFRNERALQGHDTTLRLLAQNGILVSAILLVPNGRHPDGSPHSALVHPEAEARGIYSIPNLAGEHGARFYRAALHLMAERWSQPDGPRVSNWILHNEIDQAATWTNMGAQPLARYLETYLRSARLTHHTARLFDPHARVFVSLTHHWAKKSSGSGTYIVRDLLELFAEMARTEGDFEWGVAYHPYPRDLRNPDAWKDEGLTDDFDTPYITPKNIAVLPAFLDQPRFHFQGKPRGILLSEQGFNTPTLSEADQRRQVAGLIYMFRQIRPLKTIEAFHLHRYHDMPEQEGGLRLGIITETGAHKLGWDAYQAIGTDRQAEFERIADEVMAKP